MRPSLSPRALTVLAVVLGLALRLWHYYANHTIWYDEAVLIANVMGKDFAALLGPLHNAVAAPPFYLWLLKTVHLAFGDEPYIWRALPFLCSCATLLATVPLARIALAPGLVPVAVALVALSDNHIWLGCTVKPYTGDALLTTLLLYAYLRTIHWNPVRRLLALAAVIPPVLCSSYPMAFIFGGLLLAQVPAAWRARPSGVAVWALGFAASVGTFAVLYFGPIKQQRVTGLVQEWDRDFPNWSRPITVPGWAAEHTATVFQYAFLPGGLALVALAPWGLANLARSNRRGLAVVLAVPFALTLMAAAVKSYPYGFNRLMHFISPCVLLLGCYGLEVYLHRFPRWARAATVALLVSVAVPTAIHLFKPWPKPDAQSVQVHVNAHRQPGDLIFSDEDNYLYFFFGELRKLDTATIVPPGGRAWAVMDFYKPEERRAYVDAKMRAAGLELVHEQHFPLASAFLYEKPTR
jgi:hypothetical protein